MEVETMSSFDLKEFTAAATQLSSVLGVPSEDASQEFLARYPLPLLFRLLDGGEEISDLKSILALLLEKIFKTSCGLHNLHQALPFAEAGLQANSPLTRKMTCMAISRYIEGSDEVVDLAMEALVDHNLIAPLISTIADSDSTVAKAATVAVENLAKSPIGLDLLLSDKGAGYSAFKNMLLQGSSVARIRVFSIVSSLYGHSELAALAIKKSGILSILEAELQNKDDVLAHINVLELLYELAVTSNGVKFLSESRLISHLLSTLESSDTDAFVRTRCIMVSARLITVDTSSPSPISVEDANKIIEVLDKNTKFLKDSQSSELDVAIDALGHIGSSNHGAELILCGSPPVARHIVEAAFAQREGLQKAGIHALASVAGAERQEIVLSEQAENSLRNLIFLASQNSTKRSPADLFGWLLKQDPDTRIAAYRLLSSLVARSWVLLEICRNRTLIDIVTDPRVEREKSGMEWRHACCVAVTTSLKKFFNPVSGEYSEILRKLEAAVRTGPYLSKEQVEAQPIVTTQDRF